MVQKKGKHGIRSGNTLRAINSKHFRRYRKEAYIVRRDTKLLSSCQTSNFCDVFEGANISCKDIVFSLNKKQRWLLPGLIKETFNRKEFESTDDFLDGCYQDLELVERFKIARNSNCFSIYKSQVESKQGETFHNTLLKRKGHIDADNVLKTPPLFSRHTARQLFLRDYQEQFEEETHENQPDNEENSTKENGDYIITDASPVRLEVLYPCELSNVLSLKPKLLGNSTKKTFQCRNYIRRHWTLQGYEFRRRPQKEKRENISELIKEGLQEFFDEEDEDYIECVFEENEELEYSASIIKDPWIRRNDKTYTEKTSGGKLSKDEYEAKQNSQIITTINIDEKEEEKNHERDESNKPHDKISTEQSAEIPENIADFELFPKSVGTVPVRILLRKDEITESTLQNHYSDDYLECESTPRSFVISVSKYINDLDLSGIGSTYKLLQILNKKTFSWLIFVHDPLNKLNTFSEEVYSVCLNAHFRETVSEIFIEGLVEFSVVSITEIIGKMLKYLKDLPRDTLIFEKRSSDRKNVQTTKSYSLLEEMMNWISYSYIPDNSYVIKALINSKPTSISPNGDKGLVNKGENGTELAEPCKICHMTNKNALALRSCGHYFCSRCWKSYIKVKVGTGSDVIHCPDDKCHETVGIGMIISNLDVKDILTYARLCHNKEVGKNMLARWCSNESCGRVLLANKPDIKICRCACGETMCFKCGGKPHWPLSCEQYANYINILIETRDKNITPHDFVLKFDCRYCCICFKTILRYDKCYIERCSCEGNLCIHCSFLWHSDCAFWIPNRKQNSQNSVFDPDSHGQKNTLLDGVRSKWYKLAIKHRLQQHPYRLAKLQASSKLLAKRLSHYILREERKCRFVCLELIVTEDSYMRESDKVTRYMSQMVNIYSEISNIIENIAILLDKENEVDARTNSESLHRRAMLLSTCAKTIFDLIKDGGFLNPKIVIERLQNTGFEIRRVLGSIVTDLIHNTD